MTPHTHRSWKVTQAVAGPIRLAPPHPQNPPAPRLAIELLHLGKPAHAALRHRPPPPAPLARTRNHRWVWTGIVLWPGLLDFDRFQATTQLDMHAIDEVAHGRSGRTPRLLLAAAKIPHRFLEGAQFSLTGAALCLPQPPSSDFILSGKLQKQTPRRQLGPKEWRRSCHHARACRLGCILLA